MYNHAFQGFVKFYSFWGGQTDQPPDRQTDRQADLKNASANMRDRQTIGQYISPYIISK